MSVPPEPQPSDSLNESDGSITEDEDASPSKQKEPALSLSGDLSCGLWRPVRNILVSEPIFNTARSCRYLPKLVETSIYSNPMSAHGARC